MVISITDTNISESSINDFFHNTEISVLELCHEYELDLMRRKNLNEADGDSEDDKKKDSKFATFIESIKLKIEQLARKVTDTILKQMIKLAGSKTMDIIRNINKVDKDKLALNILYMDQEIIENKKINTDNIINYDSKIGYDDPIFSGCTTVDDFVNVLRNNTTDKDKLIKIMYFTVANIHEKKNRVIGLIGIEYFKKDAIQEIKSKEKNKFIGKEEAIRQIRLIMNLYTARLKCAMLTTKTIGEIMVEHAKTYFNRNNKEQNNE